MRKLKFRICYTAQNGEKLIICPNDYESSQFKLELNGVLYEDYGSAEKPFWESVFDANYIIQQFTGLLDKNGIEIYEGDIVKRANFYYEVRWADYKFIATCPYYNQYYWPTEDLSAHKGGMFEVVGNIFETPDLLSEISKVEKELKKQKEKMRKSKIWS